MNDHRITMQLVLSAGRILLPLDLPDAIEKAKRSLEVGPFLDPTLWREKHKDLESDLEFMRAALPLWKLAMAAVEASAAEPEES